MGIGIGWAILHFSSALVAVIASALSGGTFLYIGATEVVMEDFNGKKMCKKAGLYMMGVLVIMVATAITDNTTEGHSH